MSRLKAWVAAKAKIRASFLADGFSFLARGRLTLASDESELFLVSDDEETKLVVPLVAAEFTEIFEPTLEAPEVSFGVDFFVAVALRLPSGALDLLEVAE